MELLYGLFAAIAAIAGAWFFGRHKGKSDERTEQVGRDASRVVESNKAAADAQVKAANQSTEVRDAVSRMDSGAAASDLMRDYSRD